MGPPSTAKKDTLNFSITAVATTTVVVALPRSRARGQCESKAQCVCVCCRRECTTGTKQPHAVLSVSQMTYEAEGLGLAVV